jgi:hypothetical protein
MPSYNFDNEYDVLLFGFSILIDWFSGDNNLFAAQCIWWIASLIGCTNVLRYYRQYKTFPSKHAETQNNTTEIITERNLGIPNSDIPELDLNQVSEDSESSLDSSDNDVVSSTEQFLQRSQEERLQLTEESMTDSSNIHSSSLSRFPLLDSAWPSKVIQKKVETTTRQDLINSLSQEGTPSNKKLISLFGPLSAKQRKSLREQIRRQK